MATTFRSLLAIAACGLLAACAGLGGSVAGGDAGERRPSGTRVTRSHLGGEFTRGEVAVEPRFALQAAGGVYQPGFAAAVAAELGRLGYAPAANLAASEFVATVDVATGTGAVLSARIPQSTGVAAFPNAVETQLAVQLKRRSDGSILWEGRARAPSRASRTVTAGTVQSLARAMFRDFPGETGVTVNVR